MKTPWHGERIEVANPGYAVLTLNNTHTTTQCNIYPTIVSATPAKHPVYMTQHQLFCLMRCYYRWNKITMYFFYLQSFTTESRKFQSSNKRYIFHLLASLFASNYCLRVCVCFFFCIAISELILFIAIFDERLLWALAVNPVILRENFANKYFKFLVPAFCWEKNSILVQLRIGSRHYQLGSFQIRPLVWWIP